MMLLAAIYLFLVLVFQQCEEVQLAWKLVNGRYKLITGTGMSIYQAYKKEAVSTPTVYRLLNNPYHPTPEKGLRYNR